MKLDGSNTSEWRTFQSPHDVHVSQMLIRTIRYPRRPALSRTCPIDAACERHGHQMCLLAETADRLTEKSGSYMSPSCAILPSDLCMMVMYSSCVS
jgi:hypothetical protein